MHDRAKAGDRTRGPRSWDEARRMAREGADRMTDEEDAAITAAALRDPDNPPLTEKFWKNARPLSPERLRRLRGQRGPQKSKPVKTRVSLRLDPDVVAFFRKKGAGWQSRINEALRKVAKLPTRARAAKR
jgi:uncharacterized protein (DUF4415 family)